MAPNQLHTAVILQQSTFWTRFIKPNMTFCPLGKKILDLVPSKHCK